MAIETALISIIAKEHPDFVNAPKSSQKSFIKKLIRDTVQQALLTVNLPPMKDPFEIKRNEYKYNRGSDHYRQTHKIPNYYLLEKFYNLRRMISDSNAADFLDHLKFDMSSISDKIIDVFSNTTKKQYVDFENYSKNELTSPTLFKFDMSDYKVDSLGAVRNNLTRFKIKLLDKLNTSLLVTDISVNGQTQQITNELTFTKNQKFTTDLFVLYELQTYLNFIKHLENMEFEYDDRKTILQYAYEILYDYYSGIFKIHGHTFEKDNLISYILQNDDFRNLDDENPLAIGFIMLLSNSIDVNKIITHLESK